MCQPAFFSPFLLRSLRLAARRDPDALESWLAAFQLPELAAPVRRLVDVLESGEKRVFASHLNAEPNVIERNLACSLCCCTVDVERGLDELQTVLGAKTLRRVAFVLQAMALILSDHAGRLRRSWGEYIATVDRAAPLETSC